MRIERLICVRHGLPIELHIVKIGGKTKGCTCCAKESRFRGRPKRTKKYDEGGIFCKKCLNRKAMRVQYINAGSRLCKRCQVAYYNLEAFRRVKARGGKKYRSRSEIKEYIKWRARSTRLEKKLQATRV